MPIYKNPKNGETLNTDLSGMEAAKIIRDKGMNDSFAMSLLRSWPNHSAGQSFWFFKKAISLSNPPQSNANIGILAKGMLKIAEMFKLAAGKIQKPKITFDEDFGKITLSLAPAGGNNPNCIYIKLNGVYYGKITPIGEFFPTSNCPQDVKDYVNNFADNPVEFAKEYGLKTMRCCFCQIELTDPRSRIHGWGPKCAEYYNLPWG